MPSAPRRNRTDGTAPGQKKAAISPPLALNSNPGRVTQKNYWFCPPQLRSKPLDLKTGMASGDIRKRSKALVASGSFVVALTPAVKSTYR